MTIYNPIHDPPRPLNNQIIYSKMLIKPQNNTNIQPGVALLAVFDKDSLHIYAYACNVSYVESLWLHKRRRLIVAWWLVERAKLKRPSFFFIFSFWAFSCTMKSYNPVILSLSLSLKFLLFSSDHFAFDWYMRAADSA